MAHWQITIGLTDIWKNDNFSFEEQVELIVARIKKSGWRDITPYPDFFDGLIANLESSEDKEEFNGWWYELYDQADSDRVWIETH